MDKKNSRTGTKQDRTELWEFLYDILVDPLFFAFAVSVIFTRLQSIINLTAATPTHSFWAGLEVDMEMNLG